jgi:hypothetical protein
MIFYPRALRFFPPWPSFFSTPPGGITLPTLAAVM